MDFPFKQTALKTQFDIHQAASCAPLLAVVTQSLVLDRKWMKFAKIMQFLVGRQLQNLQSRIGWKKSVKFLAGVVQSRGKNRKQSGHIHSIKCCDQSFKILTLS